MNADIRLTASAVDEVAAMADRRKIAELLGAIEGARRQMGVLQNKHEAEYRNLSQRMAAIHAMLSKM